MIGIKDIAKRAGVSTASVSYALNGTGKLSEATRQKILDIADEMNYVPNLVGRSLQQQKTNIIAIYLFDFGSFYGRLMQGAHQVLKKMGYELIVCSGENSRSFIPEKLVVGAIILDPSFPDEKVLQFAESGQKLVVLDRDLEHDNIRNVLIDNINGATLAIEELISAEVEKIIVVEGPSASFSNAIRRDTAIAVAEKAGIEVEVVTGDYSVQSGVAQGDYMLAESKKNKLGIFTLNDNMALGLYLYFKEIENFVIGRDLKIIGFDAIFSGQLADPTLSTIYFSQTSWGELAAKSLIGMLNGDDVPNKVLKTTLLKGASTDSEYHRPVNLSIEE